MFSFTQIRVMQKWVHLWLWYGQAYVMENENRCILLMVFWMQRDTVTRYWGPLLCHLSTTITSWCSMIMHGPMLKGSVHNSWKLKTSQFLHGQHTHRTCHPLSMFGMLWISVYDSEFQFLPISSNFAQPLKRSGPTFHRPQSTTWSTLCEGDVLHCVRQMVVTPDADWFLHSLWPPPTCQYSKTGHFRVAFYCGQPNAHLCNNHAVKSTSWYATPVRWMDYLGKGEVLLKRENTLVILLVKINWTELKVKYFQIADTIVFIKNVIMT